jgi:hypothetical protein
MDGVSTGNATMPFHIKESIDPLFYSIPCEIENEEENIVNFPESIISLVTTTLVLITK